MTITNERLAELANIEHAVILINTHVSIEADRLPILRHRMLPDDILQAAIDTEDALRELLSARAELERLRGEWLPVASAPRDGTHILVTVANKQGFGGWPNPQDLVTVAHWFNDGFYVSVFGGDEKSPITYTHWQPLPTPPTTGAQADE